MDYKTSVLFLSKVVSLENQSVDMEAGWLWVTQGKWLYSSTGGCPGSILGQRTKILQATA